MRYLVLVPLLLAAACGDKDKPAPVPTPTPTPTPTEAGPPITIPAMKKAQRDLDANQREFLTNNM